MKEKKINVFFINFCKKNLYLFYKKLHINFGRKRKGNVVVGERHDHEKGRQEEKKTKAKNDDDTDDKLK